MDLQEQRWSRRRTITRRREEQRFAGPETGVDRVASGVEEGTEMTSFTNEEEAS